MARVITFGTEELDRMHFRFLLSVALSGPTADLDHQGQPKRRSWAEQREDGQIIRLLKSVSLEHRIPSPSGQEDQAVRYRTLKPEGGRIILTADQFEKLKAWWVKLQWPQYDVDLAEDTWEWLCSAPEASVDAE